MLKISFVKHIKDNLKSPIFWVCIVFFAYLLWAVCPFLYVKAIGLPPNKEITFKEMFEPFGVLASIIAAVVGIVGVFFVAQTLQLQTKQFDAAKAEIAEQNKAREQQSFEASFYKLLENHRQLVREAVIFRGDEKHLRGNDAYAWLWDRINEEIKDHKDQATDPAKLMATVRGKLTVGQQDIIGGYANSILLIFKLIESKGNAKREYFYSEIVKQSLTNTERRILFASGLFDEWRILRLYLERYGFFSDLSFDLAPPYIELMNSYSRIAFEPFAAHLAFSKEELPSDSSEI